MTDAAPNNLNAVANKDFAPMEGTINDFLNHKIQASEAQKALRNEYLQINNDGVNNLIVQKLVDFSYQKGPNSELPSLTVWDGLQSANSSSASIEISGKDPNLSVEYDAKANTFTAKDSSETEANQIRAKYVQPIETTALAYFHGGMSANDAQNQIMQEVNDAAKAGYKIGDVDFNALLASTTQNDMHFSILNDGQLGISCSDSQGEQKRIEVDPAKQSVKAEDLHLTAKNIAVGAAKFAGFGAAAGAFTGPAAPIGAAIGAAGGAGVGAIEGSILVYELDKELKQHPDMIFNM
jgi:hypothetical protein